MSRIRVLIADDHALMRAGLRAYLAMQRDLEVVGEAADGVVVVEECRRLRPDVVLMDLAMPGRGGISAIEDLRRVSPKVRILAVTMHDDETFARQALLAGAAGYVLKLSVPAELLAAIRVVHKGGRYIAAPLAAAVASSASAPPPRAPCDGVLSRLTPREQGIVSLIALGHTNLELARRLHISVKTVETHRRHIMDKLGLQTRADLVRLALEHGLMKAGKAASSLMLTSKPRKARSAFRN